MAVLPGLMPAVGAYCDDPPPFSITPADTTYKAVGAQVEYEGACSGTGAHDLYISISGGLTGVNTNEDGNEITLTGTADTPDSYTVSGECTEHDCSDSETLKIVGMSMEGFVVVVNGNPGAKATLFAAVGVAPPGGSASIEWSGWVESDLWDVITAAALSGTSPTYSLDGQWSYNQGGLASMTVGCEYTVEVEYSLGGIKPFSCKTAKIKNPITLPPPYGSGYVGGWLE